MDKDTTKSTFMEYLLPLDREFLLKQIEKLKLDRYTKKLDTITFSKLFVFAQLKHIGSLADISLELRTSEELQQELELESISTSQLSRKLRDLNPSMYEATLGHLIRQVHRQFGFQKGTQALGKLNLIVSSTISLCLTRYRWAEFRNTKAGIKIYSSDLLRRNGKSGQSHSQTCEGLRQNGNERACCAMHLICLTAATSIMNYSINTAKMEHGSSQG
jgi:hypothetical protein